MSCLAIAPRDTKRAGAGLLSKDRALTEVIAQVVRQTGVAQAAQGFLFKLADALTAEAELVGNLFKRVRLSTTQAKTQPQDVALAGGSAR